jgi:predicted transcriptional regulator
MSDSASSHSRSTTAYLNVTLASIALIKEPSWGTLTSTCTHQATLARLDMLKMELFLSPHPWRLEPAVSELVAERDWQEERLAAHQAFAADGVFTSVGEPTGWWQASRA